MRSTRNKFYSSKPCDKLVAKKNVFTPCCSQNHIPFLKEVGVIYKNRTRTTEEQSIFMDKVMNYLNIFHRFNTITLPDVNIHARTKNGMNLLILSEKFKTSAKLTIFMNEETGFIPLPESSSRAIYVANDIKNINAPLNKIMTITGNKSSVLFDSIDYFNKSPESQEKRIRGMTYFKVDIPLITDLTDKVLITKIAQQLIDIGKILADDIMFTKSVFEFTFPSSTLSNASTIRIYLLDMAFEDGPNGSIYREQITDRIITVEIVNPQYRDVTCLMKVDKAETLGQITREPEAVEPPVPITRHIPPVPITRHIPDSRAPMQFQPQENFADLSSRYTPEQIWRFRLEMDVLKANHARQNVRNTRMTNNNYARDLRIADNIVSESVKQLKKWEKRAKSRGVNIDSSLLSDRLSYSKMLEKYARLDEGALYVYQIDGPPLTRTRPIQHTIRFPQDIVIRTNGNAYPTSAIDTGIRGIVRVLPPLPTPIYQEQIVNTQTQGRISQRLPSVNTQTQRRISQRLPSVNPSVNVPKLSTYKGDETLLESMATDIITFEDMSVSDYLDQDEKNIVLFEHNLKPHFTNIDDLKVAMEDGIVYGCKEVSTRLIQPLSNVDVKNELFNARRIGTLSGYINAKNLKSAIHSAESGDSSKLFLITKGIRSVPAVISKKVFNQMDNIVSANHCQVGAEGEVHNVMEISIGDRSQNI